MRLFLFALLMFSGVAQAGYYVSITATNGGSYWAGVSSSSPCMLTVGMAITKVANQTYANSVVVTALDPSAKTWSAFNAANSSLNVTGNYFSCDTSPGGAVQPAMPAGVSDPGISGGSITGGTGSTSGGSLTIDGLGFEQEAFELAFQAALLMFVTGLGIGLLVQIIRRMRTP